MIVPKKKPEKYVKIVQIEIKTKKLSIKFFILEI